MEKCCILCFISISFLPPITSPDTFLPTLHISLLLRQVIVACTGYSWVDCCGSYWYVPTSR